VDTLEAFDDHRAHAQQQRALGRPVAARSGAVFLAADHHQRRAVPLVPHRRVIDRHQFALVAGHATLDALHHLVTDADIGKGAAHHHLVIAAAAAIGVEVRLLQILPGRTVFLDRASGRDVIGGDRIAQDRQRHRLGHVGHRRRGHRHPLEIGRIGDIGAARAPLVGVGRLYLDCLPVLVALVDIGIALLEHGAVDIGGAVLGHFLIARPQILEENVVAVLVLPDRRRGNVQRHGSQKRVGDHQRRAGKEVGAHIGRNPALEIAVARKYAGRDDVVAVDRLADRRGERARIADAGGAAIADQIETDRIEMVLEA